MTALFDDAARERMRANQKIFAETFSYDGTPVRDMVIKPIPIPLARQYIAAFHYSHTMPDSTRFCYGGFLNGRLCGVACYGMGCAKSEYTALLPNIENGTYIELTRLWCANDYPRNTESKLIAESLKLLPPEIKLVISFADESEGHCGIIYQATNWYYLGMSGGGRMILLDNGVMKHTRLLGIYRLRHPEYRAYTNQELLDIIGGRYVVAGRKHRYVYLRGREKRELYKAIEDRIMPYPKCDKKQSLDESQMVNQIQGDKDCTQTNIYDFI